VLINSIPLLEAQASSEIENIVTTTDRLFRFANEEGNQADPATKEALRYRTALNRVSMRWQSDRSRLRRQ
jgi:Fic family protein